MTDRPGLPDSLPIGWCHSSASHAGHVYTYMGADHWCRGSIDQPARLGGTSSALPDPIPDEEFFGPTFGETPAVGRPVRAEAARAVANHLRVAGAMKALDPINGTLMTALPTEVLTNAADTIDALVADLERAEADVAKLSTANAELETDLERKDYWKRWWRDAAYKMRDKANEAQATPAMWARAGVTAGALAVAEKELAEARAELERVTRELEAMNNLRTDAIDERLAAEARVEALEARLRRAGEATP